MAVHRFTVGSHVSLTATHGQTLPTSSFIVEMQMPPVGAFLQYRIKNEAEGFRRVVVEHQLSPFGATPPVVVPVFAAVHAGEED